MIFHFNMSRDSLKTFKIWARSAFIIAFEVMVVIGIVLLISCCTPFEIEVAERVGEDIVESIIDETNNIQGELNVRPNNGAAV